LKVERRVEPVVREAEHEGFDGHDGEEPVRDARSVEEPEEDGEREAA
jgi:hypothetical protein